MFLCVRGEEGRDRTFLHQSSEATLQKRSKARSQEVYTELSTCLRCLTDCTLNTRGGPVRKVPRGRRIPNFSICETNVMTVVAAERGKDGKDNP